MVAREGAAIKAELERVHALVAELGVERKRLLRRRGDHRGRQRPQVSRRRPLSKVKVRDVIGGTVNKDGVTYKGKHYSSLSGAAVAAAEDLGLGSRSHNGFVFWGLSKPPRAQKDPVDRLQGIYERYAEAAKSGLALVASDESKRKQVRTQVERHAEAILKLIA